MGNRLPLVFSTTALVIAVLGITPFGDAAYNAVVPRNSVGTLQLKRNAVTSSKLAPNTVRTGQVVDGTLLTADFRTGQIPQGPKGDKGSKGSKGDPGPPGISGRQVVTASSASDSTNFKQATAQCPVGTVPIGGGASILGAQVAALTASFTATGINAYKASAIEPVASSASWSLNVIVNCVKVAP